MRMYLECHENNPGIGERTNSNLEITNPSILGILGNSSYILGVDYLLKSSCKNGRVHGKIPTVQGRMVLRLSEFDSSQIESHPPMETLAWYQIHA